MIPPGGTDLLIAALAGAAAGVVNALAGGGTLITFPTLTALGMPALAANVTNTVALCPGYLGATMAQRGDLRGQGRRLWLLVPAGVLGGLAGGFLLLRSGERTFRALVPFLILLASALLAAQEPLRAWLKRRSARVEGATDDAASCPAGVGADSGVARVAPAAGLAAVYGGYFGAGLSVIVLAVLGLLLDDSLTRLNALKQAIAFGVNVAAAVLFALAGPVVWPAALAMAAGALLGGTAGGRLAGRVRPATLRRIVVIIGVAVAVVYFVR